MTEPLTAASETQLDIDIYVELGPDSESPEPGSRPERIESRAAAAGQLIGGKYRIERQIAVGGMGVVYACTDVILDRAAAVKVIHPSIACDESIQARFNFEARTLARLNNPHVTRVFESGYIEGGELYIAMELLEGIDLYQLVQQEGALPAERVARLALQVCLGLRDAHALGIVHRDLKPENLFLTRSRSGAELLKIIDFGISKQHSPSRGRALTQPSTNMGSPYYMAPEQFRAPSDVDSRADVWSLGATMYELLTGHPPFDGEDWQSVFAAVLTSAPAALGPSVPPALEAVVLRCLERDREARFDNVDQIAQALRGFLGGRRSKRQSSSSRSVPPVSLEVMVQPRPVWGRRLATWAGALCVVAAGAGGAKLLTDSNLLEKATVVVSSWNAQGGLSAAGVAPETGAAPDPALVPLFSSVPVPARSVPPSAVASVAAPQPSVSAKPIRKVTRYRRPPAAPRATGPDAAEEPYGPRAVVASAGALPSGLPDEPTLTEAAWAPE